jgi:putative transposase
LTLETNAVAERVIGTLRRECLDQIIPLDERHLRAILTQYVDYYNHHRPHRTLQLRPPRPQERPQARPVRPSPGTPVRSRPILGGLHHVYEYAA